MSGITTINPTTGELIAVFDADRDEVVEQRLVEATAAVRLLKDAGIGQRAAWMRRTADILEEDIDGLSELITLEMGKPLGQARSEVTKSAYTLRFYAEHAESFLTGRNLSSPAAVNASDARVQYSPMGVVLAVMPWNYPVWQVIRFAAPALMAGNAGILKHASNVPQTARYLSGLFRRAGFPQGAFSSLLIGSARVADVIRDPRVAAVTLTGSESAGEAVAALAGSLLKKVVLELGGSDPFLVMPSADLEAAVSTAVMARISNNGQACINAKRFIVHEQIYDTFLDRLVERFASLKVGDPIEPDVQVGPLATKGGRDDLEALVEDARLKGAIVHTGGDRGREARGWFYQPTVIDSLRADMRLWSEEAFGPVASMFKVSSLEEAVTLANGSDYGLGSAIWSNEPDEIAYAVDELAAGAVFVNGMTISYPELPFGGVKRSGYGRELSIEGILEFCTVKSVWIA